MDIVPAKLKQTPTFNSVAVAQAVVAILIGIKLRSACAALPLDPNWVLSPVSFFLSS